MGGMEQVHADRAAAQLLFPDRDLVALDRARKPATIMAGAWWANSSALA